MRPASIGSPSCGLQAGSGPARVSTIGSTLFTPGARCHTTKSEAGSPRGRPATSCSSAAIPPAEAPTTTISFFAILPAVQLSSLGQFVDQENHAFALLRGGQERGAGDLAADFLAAAVDGIERDFLVIDLAQQAGPDRRAHLAHRQADVEVEERAALHLVGPQPPEF